MQNYANWLKLFSEYEASDFALQNPEDSSKMLGKSTMWWGNTLDMNGRKMTDNFYEKGKDFDYTFNNNPDITNQTKFLQVIWKSAEEVGFGIVLDKHNEYRGCAFYNLKADETDVEGLKANVISPN